MSTDVCRILVAGGCHAAGFPVGAERAFPAVLRAELGAAGIVTEIRCLTHLPLHKPERLKQACEEFAPEVLVLQVGHFELTRKLADLLPAGFGRRAPAASSRDPEAQPIAPAEPAYRLRTRAKLAIDHLFRHPLVDRQRFAGRLDGFLCAAASCGPPNILLLSPLPCADPVSLGYRVRAEDAYRELAVRYGLHYLNALKWTVPVTADNCGPEGFYADAAHLGVGGHRKAGREIAAQIITSLRCADEVLTSAGVRA